MENDIPIQDLLGEQENTESWKDDPEFLEKIERYIESISDKGSEDIQFDNSITEHNPDRISELIFQSTTDLMLYLDRSGRIIKINNAGIAFSGFNVSDIIGKRFWKMPGVFSRHNLSKFILVFINSLKGSSTTCFTCELSDKSGKQHIMEFSTYPIKRNNCIGQILVIGKDMTQYKETESQMKDAVESLRKSEEKYRGLFDESIVAVYLFDTEKNFIDSNQAGLDLLGYSREELMKMSIPDVDADPIVVLPAHKNLFDGGRLINYEHQLKHKDGRIITVLNNSRPIIDSEGNVTGLQSTLLDITERKQAEGALKSSEEKFRLLADNLNDVVFTQDMDLNITYVSPSAKAMFGYNIEEAYDLKIEEIMTAESYKKAMDSFQEYKHLVQDKKEIDIPILEFEYVRKDGSTFWGELKINFLKDSQGKLIATQGAIRDITERKQAEEMLRKSENNLRIFFDTVDNFHFILDAQGKIQTVNKQVTERLGYAAEELIGQSVLIVHPKEHWADVEKVINDILDGKRKTCTIPLMAKNGEQVFVETYAVWSTWDGNPAIFGTSKDISALKKSEEKFSKAFQCNPAIAGISDIETGKYIEVNRNFYKILGFTPEEVIGKRASDVVRMDIRFRDEVLEKLKRNNFIRNEEAVVYTKDGKPIDVLLSAEVITINGKKYNYTTGLDISSRKQVEEELRKAHVQLQNLNSNLEKKVQERTQMIEELLKQKDDFINQLGHDLKNPLGPLLNLLPLLEKKETDPTKKEILHVANRNVEYMKNLVTKTIKLAQLRSPTTLLNYETTNMNHLVSEIIETNSLFFQEHNVSVTNNIDEDIVVDVDKLKIDEVFNNILNNAVKYIDQENGSININHHMENGSITISISDTGKGMTNDQLSKVFNEFYKADGSRHDFESSGLGLTIVKRIIEMHGGRIWAESEGIGKGSTFYFSLPLCRERNTASSKNQIVAEN
ncbi:MAG: PAS domain S-box protein [Candidatus Thermoplasmatota archaeon]|nr:PAS domain S-box protein [Candidatus Thermoplasmatota archaeon]